MVFYLEVDNACNNNCIGCDKLSKKTSKKEELLKSIKDARELGYSSVLLSGGEFTIYPYFFEILDNLATNRFLKIYLMTNGRRFSDKNFIKKLLNYPFKEFIIPLYGPNEKIHQALKEIESFPPYFLEIEIEDFSRCCLDKLLMSKKNIFVRISCSNFIFKNNLLASYPGVFLIEKKD